MIPKAKEKFAEVSAAYEILGDEKKRGAFDRGEIDAEGKPRFQGFEGFGAGGPGAGLGRGGRSPAVVSNISNSAPTAVPAAPGFDASDLFSELFGGQAGSGAVRDAGAHGGRQRRAARTSPRR